jgi:hypothetical protein
MGILPEINVEICELLWAQHGLAELELRLSAGIQALHSTTFNYSTGAGAEAIKETVLSLEKTYQQAQELVRRSRRFLANAERDFSQADWSAAQFFFLLHGSGQVRPGFVLGAIEGGRRR